MLNFYEFIENSINNGKVKSSESFKIEKRTFLSWNFLTPIPTYMKVHGITINMIKTKIPNSFAVVSCIYASYLISFFMS